MSQALNLGVTCLDLELAADAGFRREIGHAGGQPNSSSPGTILPARRTQSRLDAVLEEMLAAEADIVKLVTLAREPADNLRLLSLIPRAKAQARKSSPFAWDRWANGPGWPRRFWGAGSPSPPSASIGASAPGQLTVNDLKRVWMTLK